MSKRLVAVGVMRGTRSRPRQPVITVNLGEPLAAELDKEVARRGPEYDRSRLVREILRAALGSAPGESP